MPSTLAMLLRACSIGRVNAGSVALAVGGEAGALLWAVTTTTGKVISGNSAYLSELKAMIPATVIANQNPIVSQGTAIANREILKRSRLEVGRRREFIADCGILQDGEATCNPSRLAQYREARRGVSAESTKTARPHLCVFKGVLYAR